MLRRNFVFTYPCPRRMREIVKMTLIERETPDKVRDVWNTYHSARANNVSCVLTGYQFNLLKKRTKASPFFIFPIMRKGGHFMLLSQSQDNSNLFTFLEDFKKSPENATPYLVLTMFDELLGKKDIVPVRGDVIDHLVSKTEAENIMMAYLAHYLETGLYEDLVHVFNHNPSKFNHESFIQGYLSRFSPKKEVK